MTTATAACLMCGSTSLGSLYQGVRDHYGFAPGLYAFLGCAECGSATLEPLPAAEELPRFYPPAYTFKAEAPRRSARMLLLGAAEGWFYRSMYRARLGTFARLAGLASGRVLEVGCGSGHFLEMLAAAGYDAEGLEISKTDVAYARDRLGLRVVCGTLETAALVEGSYDAVLMYAVLEHVLNPADTVRRIFRLLQPGGVVVLGVPVIDSLQARLLGRRWCQVTEAPRHVMIPSCRAVARLLRQAGFCDVRSAPAPMLENAGCVALSLLPRASTPVAYGEGGGGAPRLARCVGALLVLPSLALALMERVSPSTGGAGTTMFSARRPARGRAT